MPDYTDTQLKAEIDALTVQAKAAEARALEAKAATAAAASVALRADEAVKALALRVAALELDPVDPPPVDPPPVDPPPVEPPVVGRPFAASSPWNTKKGTRTVDTVRTATLRNQGQPWINWDRNSHPIFQATTSDPVVTHTDVSHSPDPSWPWLKTIQWPLPANAKPDGGDDHHVHIISPDGRYVLETIYFARTPNGAENVRMAKVDLQGSGLGPQNGTRAYGGSAIAGLITKRDVDQGVIDHALAVALPFSMLYSTGTGNRGWVLDPEDPKFGWMTGISAVNEGTEEDWAGIWNYSHALSALPMTTHIDIDPAADISKLSPQLQQIAKALQTYGGMIVDTTGGGSDVTFYAEPTVPLSFIQGCLPGWGRGELQKLQRLLRVVAW